MGKALAEVSAAARYTFQEAEDALAFPLTKLLWQGPEEALRLTQNAQPAITAVSIAALRAFGESKSITPAYVAGHSLGEYAALVCANMLTFADALKATRERGRLMQEAVPVGQGVMAAVVGLSAEAIEEIVQSLNRAGKTLAIAGYNSPEQTTLSGSKDAVDAATAPLMAAGAKRVLPLPVSAPFHCLMMQPVQDPLRVVLQQCPVGDGVVPVISNVDALPYQRGSDVVDRLIRQLTQPVRWTATVDYFVKNGVTHTIEFGPGKSLSGMIKKIARQIETWVVEDSESLARSAALPT